jgi:hypothetical protein
MKRTRNIKKAWRCCKRCWVSEYARKSHTVCDRGIFSNAISLCLIKRVKCLSMAAILL